MRPGRDTCNTTQISRLKKIPTLKSFPIGMSRDRIGMSRDHLAKREDEQNTTSGYKERLH